MLLKYKNIFDFREADMINLSIHDPKKEEKSNIKVFSE